MDDQELTIAELREEVRKLKEACKAIEEWWLREGMHAFDCAPAAIFMVRKAIDPDLGRYQEDEGV